MPPAALTLARLAAGPDPGPADGELLRAFAAGRDDDPFAELVRRHGPMVLAACRRALGNPHDADDAFQATFLVLARKAHTVRGNLAAWLYAVAVRTARGVRVMRDRRRRKHSIRSQETGDRSQETAPPSDTRILVTEQAAIIDEELAKLADHYREAVVLCELRGLSRKQAAAELGIPEGTLSSRLAAAKRKLAALLAARGLAAPAAPVLGPSAVSPGLAAAAVAAARGAAGPVASAAASAVVKGMLFDQLKAVTLAAGFLLTAVCGGLAMSGSPGDQGGPAVAPAPRPADPRKLVEQLGAPEFADREAAEKALRELGVRAKPALRAGLTSDSPEVRDRAAKALAAARRDQIWDVFARIAGDAPSARDLFAKVMGSQRGVNALEAVLDDPARADEAYRTRTAELMRVAAGHPPVDADGKASVPTAPDVWAAPPPPLGDVAGWLLLGALQPGTAPWADYTVRGWEHRLGSHVPFLPEDDYTSAKPIAAAYAAADAAPLKKLTAAWLARRRENDMLRAGLALAIRYDIADAAAARIVLNDPKPAEISPWNLAAAAVFLGLHGTKDDLPLLARHVADDRNYSTTLNLPKDFDWVGAIPTEEGRDLFCRVRDAVAVSMCKLAGKNPADFGFPPFPQTKHPNGAPTSLSSATKVGFVAKADRAKAFEKAAAWLKSFEPAEAKKEPAKGAKFWPRFEDLLGDDKANRALFDRIAADPKNLELLEKAEELLAKAWAPGANAEALAAPDRLYLARRDELNTLADAGTISLPAVYGWMYLATYRAAYAPDRRPGWPRFLPDPRRPAEDRTGLIRELTGPGGAAARRLVVAWADRQDPDDGGLRGLELALACGIKEGVGPAGRILATAARARPGAAIDPRTGVALLLVGKCGDESDLPAVAKLLDDAREIHRPGGPPGRFVEGEYVANQVRDTAAVVMIVLRGGRPEDFGFIWTKTDARKLVPGADALGSGPLDVRVIGFSTEADRKAAHEKARAWLDKQGEAKPGPKNPGPTKPEPDPAVLKLVEQLGAAEFADREAAEKGLRKLGLPAEAALRTGLKSDNPEVRERAGKLLIAVRADSREALVKAFDPAKEELPDHPLWRRFRSIAGDTPASRDMFARIIGRPQWLRTLDEAEADPAAAARAYREAFVALGRRLYLLDGPQDFGPQDLNRMYTREIEGAAYLLFLGSYPGTLRPRPERPGPDDRHFSYAESYFTSGSLDNGLHGEQAKFGASPEHPNPPKLKEAVPGTDRVFARLLAAWLPNRTNPETLTNGLDYVTGHGVEGVLPFARRVAADTTQPPKVRCHALLVVAKFGTPADLPLFEPLFADETVVATVDLSLVHRGTPKIEGTAAAQARDVAVGLALLLRDEDPRAHGFKQARGWPWRKPDERLDVANYIPWMFGFPEGEDAARTAAHAKARAWLDKRK